MNTFVSQEGSHSSRPARIRSFNDKTKSITMSQCAYIKSQNE